MKKPVGYIEKVGRCTIKKVQHYGYKYRLFIGQCFYKFASLEQARAYAKQRDGQTCLAL